MAENWPVDEFEERRRLERDLHDGVQQQLVALAVNLQLARRLVDDDPAGAGTLLEQMGHDVKEALADVRRLAWKLYPSLLLDRGLGDALREAAAGADGIATVEASNVERFPAELEAAVYFCFVDALESGREAAIKVWQEQDVLRFEIAVDGAERVATRAAERLRADDAWVTGSAGVVSGGLTRPRPGRE